MVGHRRRRRKTWAERRGGELLKDTARDQGETDKTIRSHDVTLSPPPKLEELGITKRESHQAQQASHDGEFSRELPKDKGGRPDNNSTHDGESYQTKLYILKDAGITHQ